jgi:FixJ family two-component response regulator
MMNVEHSAVQSAAPLIGIVDDDQSVRDSISSFVRSTGLRSTTFASGEAILNSKDGYEADCLILDVRMPGLSGLELQRRLADVECLTPVIFVSANPGDEVREKALRQGAIAFLETSLSAKRCCSVPSRQRSNCRDSKPQGVKKCTQPQI